MKLPNIPSAPDSVLRGLLVRLYEQEDLSAILEICIQLSDLGRHEDLSRFRELAGQYLLQGPAYYFRHFYAATVSLFWTDLFDATYVVKAAGEYLQKKANNEPAVRPFGGDYP